MDREIVSWLQSLRDSAGAFLGALTAFGQTMLLPSRLLQIGVALALVLVAWAGSRWLGPRVEAWIRGLEGRPKWTGGLTNIRGTVFLALWDAFKEHGIPIPFPQREVTLLNERLAVDSPDPPAAAGPNSGESSAK